MLRVKIVNIVNTVDNVNMFAFKFLTCGIAGRIYEHKMVWQPLYQHPPTVLVATGEDRPG